MSTITTDYTESAQINTLCAAPLTRYRFAHWLCDVVRNFMSDPEHIRDERLRGLLWPQDGIEPDNCRASFQVGLPLAHDSRKACVTPALLVSVGQQTYPTTLINAGTSALNEPCGRRAMLHCTTERQVTGKIAIVTESLDGTLLLCDLLEDYLVINEKLFPMDGLVSALHCNGSSEPAMIRVGEAANAKELYQTVIGVTAVGGMAWDIDTQGPTFRGLDTAAGMV